MDDEADGAEILAPVIAEEPAARVVAERPADRVQDEAALVLVFGSSHNSFTPMPNF